VIQSPVNLCMGIAKIYAGCEFLSDCPSNLFSKMPICINCTCILFMRKQQIKGNDANISK
jgi:hypothetical protein